MTKIIPAAIAYQQRLLGVVTVFFALKDLVTGIDTEVEHQLLQMIAQKIKILNDGCAEIKNKVSEGLANADLGTCARFLSDHVAPLLEQVRKPADELETVIADEFWPLPKYSEMLFIL